MSDKARLKKQFSSASGDDFVILNLAQIYDQFDREDGSIGAFIEGSDSEGDDEVPLWLVSFTDVLALMLTFFVLLFAMSVPDDGRRSGGQNFYRQDSRVVVTERPEGGLSQDIRIDSGDVKAGLDLQYLQNLLQQYVQTRPEFSDMIMMRGGDRLIVSLPAGLTFGAGSDRVQASGVKALKALAKLLKRVPNSIAIVGHCDPSAIKGGAFANNWELSLARANAVARGLKGAGYKKPLQVRGEASSRYGMTADQLSDGMRDQLARRVDIVIYPHAGEI